MMVLGSEPNGLWVDEFGNIFSRYQNRVQVYAADSRTVQSVKIGFFKSDI